MDRLDPKIRELHDQVQAAVARAAGDDATRISVGLNGTRATLKGGVRTWAEHEAAERGALATPGVNSVDNRLCLYVTGIVASS